MQFYYIDLYTGTVERKFNWGKVEKQLPIGVWGMFIKKISFIFGAPPVPPPPAPLYLNFMFIHVKISNLNLIIPKEEQVFTLFSPKCYKLWAHVSKNTRATSWVTRAWPLFGKRPFICLNRRSIIPYLYSTE